MRKISDLSRSIDKSIHFKQISFELSKVIFFSSGDQDFIVRIIKRRRALKALSFEQKHTLGCAC